MRLHDLLLGLVILISAVIIYSVAVTFPDQNDGKPGAWLFPGALSILFGLCGIGLMIKGALHFKERPLVTLIPGLTLQGFFKILAVCAFIIFYIECSEYLGFIITMFIVMFLMLMMLGNKLWVALVSAPLATVAIYLIFAKVLLVPLAEGLFSF
jgi:putative tricarboxylic transport membrane protein